MSENDGLEDLLDELDEPEEDTYIGMDERTYIATAAMQGILSNPNSPAGSPAELAISYADHLIALLEKDTDAVS